MMCYSNNDYGRAIEKYHYFSIKPDTYFFLIEQFFSYIKLDTNISNWYLSRIKKFIENFPNVRYEGTIIIDGVDYGDKAYYFDYSLSIDPVYDEKEFTYIYDNDIIECPNFDCIKKVLEDLYMRLKDNGNLIHACVLSIFFLTDPNLLSKIHNDEMLKKQWFVLLSNQSDVCTINILTPREESKNCANIY